MKQPNYRYDVSGLLVEAIETYSSLDSGDYQMYNVVKYKYDTENGVLLSTTTRDNYTDISEYSYEYYPVVLIKSEDDTITYFDLGFSAA